MVKKHAGLTERRWRDSIVWVLTNNKFAFGARCEHCYRWRGILIHCGDWENFPADLKINVGLYALIYEREMFPDMRENDIKRLKETIERLETEKQGFIAELAAMEGA